MARETFRRTLNISVLLDQTERRHHTGKKKPVLGKKKGGGGNMLLVFIGFPCTTVYPKSRGSREGKGGISRRHRLFSKVPYSTRH